MLEKEASKGPPLGMSPNQFTRVGRRPDPIRSRILDAYVSSLNGEDGALGWGRGFLPAPTLPADREMVLHFRHRNPKPYMIDERFCSIRHRVDNGIPLRDSPPTAEDFRRWSEEILERDSELLQRLADAKR